MATVDDLRESFRPKSVELGERYFQEGRVKIERAEDGAVSAVVSGSFDYSVEMEWTDGELWSDCTCPYAGDHEDPCKHVWATLRAADELGYLKTDAEDFDPYQTLPVKPIPMPPAKPRLAIWRRRIQEFRQLSSWRNRPAPTPWKRDRQIIYVLSPTYRNNHWQVKVELMSRTPARKGVGFTAPKRLRLEWGQVPQLEEADRHIIALITGAHDDHYWNGFPGEMYLRESMSNELTRMICQTGRGFFKRDPAQELRHLHWDDEGPWNLRLALEDEDPGKTFRLEGAMVRGEESVPLSKVDLIARDGPVIMGATAAAMIDDGAEYFVELLKSGDEIIVPSEQGDDFLQELLQFPRLPQLQLPPSLQVASVSFPMQPHLRLHPSRGAYDREKLQGEITFHYGQYSIAHHSPLAAHFDRETRQMVQRDSAAEQRAMARVLQIGLSSRTTYDGAVQLSLPLKKLPAVVRALSAENWRVEVDGKVYRQSGKVHIDVSSGIDWFEIRGQAEFDGVTVALPALLKAVRKGESTIVLDDGTVGIVPEEWMKRYGLLAALGDNNGDAVQFAKNQVGLLDALLAEMPMVNVDETFHQARTELRTFAGIGPVEPPKSFEGLLRPYQSEGLGWMHFLRRFGLNGCLADDMGLGKTVQVLALMEERRIARQAGQIHAPSLVVVPRSLVFNWHQEAAKFAPKLRVLDHASAGRSRQTSHFKDFDIILTTYGTLRNDAAMLKDITFDYVILDEAQMIKNAGSESAKAARLVRADHRMVLSGTPVQNHLGELWSLFEFLNPGMLGASSAFASISTSRNPDPQTRSLLAAALRPFVLRRTKEQVARDLPEKFEQTLFCELDKTQRKLYDELKEHYRQSLLNRIAQEGINKSRIQILEALLRLRQAACHPGLLDKGRLEESSAKLDTLLPRLEEVAAEGHKVIVFSQFTSFLSIVRSRLDARNTVYEYLDGKTRDRQQRVTRFQTDPNCKLFLISLKAGGLGLNLTAAQYVFLLDPWWNPAIEAQAVDRAHRIGQTQKVFAYRLIARDTVEEKVLQLQKTKKDLADAIINADNAILSNLGRQELELLLS